MKINIIIMTLTYIEYLGFLCIILSFSFDRIDISENCSCELFNEFASFEFYDINAIYMYINYIILNIYFLIL